MEREIRRFLKNTEVVGHELIYLKETDSTNNDVKRLAKAGGMDGEANKNVYLSARNVESANVQTLSGLNTLDEDARQPAAERIGLMILERHDQLAVRGDITPAGIVEIFGIGAETHHGGTHLAELGGIVPLGGDHFTPLGVDIAATRLHTLEIHAVEVGIERRQPVVEPADAFIAERADLTAVAVDEPEIDIVVAHHGHPAREVPFPVHFRKFVM